MRILYDHQAFSEQTYGGVSRYYAELISGVNNTVGNKAHLSLLFSNNIHLKEKHISLFPFFSEKRFWKKNEIMYKANEFYSLFSLNNLSYDIFHTTNYNPYFINHLKKKPFIVTFYDMIHERFSGKYKELNDVSLITKHKKLIAQKANCIIAISESTKRDIVDLLNINPEKIKVVYLGSSFTDQIEDRLSIIKKPYLLYVGKRDAYKNFLFFLKAVSPILKQYKITLVCAGGGHFTDEELSQIKVLGLEKYIQQEYIDSDNTLQKLYKSALGFVFPSLYEGFGIPVLEAFSCGCPCILSNTSSLPEVAGDAAIYFDPLNATSISNTIETILIDTEMSKSLITRGLIRLKKFSWERTVNETLAVYKSCI